MSKIFPQKIGGDLAGKSFDEIFKEMPDIIEFVSDMWNEEKCTGIFLDFMKYVKHRLSDEIELAEHEMRCINYVHERRHKLDKLPCYLNKYISLHDVNDHSRTK